MDTPKIFFEEQPLYTSGIGGYFRYRIPALVTTLNGSILVFCEARKYNGRDSDQIDLLICRSTDNGKTFSDPQLIVTQSDWVCGNPAPVVDLETGIIWLLFCKNHKDIDEKTICLGKGERSVWLTSSDDDGLTWKDSVDITGDVKQPDWGWYATGPGHGIQLQNGRLLISCDHSLIIPHTEYEVPYFSHVIFSDDHGKTWHIGGTLLEGTNECMAVETIDGKVYVNSRNAPYSLWARSGIPEHSPDNIHRAYAWSTDGGQKFSLVEHDQALPEPICQASICRLSNELEHDCNRIIFVNPASNKRENLTIRVSYDECRSWSLSRLLHAGFAQYSDLCIANDGTIFCLYEWGENEHYEALMLARFNLGWLEAYSTNEEIY